MTRLNRCEVSEKVKEMIEKYLVENLPYYTLVKVERKSNHPNDHYLYMVVAQHNNDTYAVWTCFNSETNSMNYGHYGLETIEECEQILNDFYYNI